MYEAAGDGPAWLGLAAPDRAVSSRSMRYREPSHYAVAFATDEGG